MPHPLLPLIEEFVDLPDLRCPTCTIGHLTLPKPFALGSDAATQKAQQQRPEDFDPDWITGRFTGFAECASSRCGDRVAMAGDWRVVHVGQGTTEYDNVFRLTYTRPALTLVDSPTGTPEPVISAVTAAAEIVWSDPSAAGSRLRVAVEELLNAKKIPRHEMQRRPGQPTRKRLRSTHERINLFGARKPQVQQVLLAVKWIGNSGSHRGTLTVEDVLEGAEMLSLALRLICDPPAPRAVTGPRRSSPTS